MNYYGCDDQRQYILEPQVHELGLLCVEHVNL